MKLQLKEKFYSDYDSFSPTFDRYYSSNSPAYFLFNTNEKVGFMCSPEFSVYIEVSNRKADDFAHIYFNGSTVDPDICAIYRINPEDLNNFMDDAEYYDYLEEHGVIDRYEIMDYEECPAKILDCLFGRASNWI